MKRIVGVLAMALVAGCGADNSVAASTARLVVSLQAAQISVTRGSRTSVGAAVTRENGVASNITITAVAPAGITVTVTNETNAGTTTTATLAVSVGSGVNPGRYTVVVIGHALNYPDASADLVLELDN